MSEQDRREWKFLGTIDGSLISVYGPMVATNESLTLVLKSRYDEALAEIERLKVIADEFHKRAGMGITRWSKVMEENQKLREALELAKKQRDDI